MSAKSMFLNVVSALGLVAATASFASAATLNVVGGTSTVLPATYDPSCGGCTNPAVGDSVQAYTGLSFTGGLMIDAPTTLRFTFVGKEAGAKNVALAQAGQQISNTSAIGTSVSYSQATPGKVAFGFRTFEAGWEDINGNNVTGEAFRIINGAGSTFSNLTLGLGTVFNGGKSVYAFFGDGRGDVDFDDMVIRIDAIPVPATALLLVTGLFGLGTVRRMKKAS